MYIGKKQLGREEKTLSTQNQMECDKHEKKVKTKPAKTQIFRNNGFVWLLFKMTKVSPLIREKQKYLCPFINWKEGS